jgi:[amino group carrier protein]-L-2-aminoadipate/L-glutamate 6-kinase
MLIIKIGGGSTIQLERIAYDLQEVKEPYIIVHGANALRDRLANDLGKEMKRVTSFIGYASVLSDKETIDLQMMAYAGLRNKRIVEMLQKRGINAIGLSGLDGAVIRGKRNPGIRVMENGKRKMLRDFSGKPSNINRDLLDMLIKQDYVPVLTVPIIDENGFAINSENDDIVSLIQKEYHAEQVIHLIEAAGLLRDSNDPGSLIQSMSLSELQQWELKSDGRIKRKLLSIQRLLESGAQQVIIGDGRSDHPINSALQGIGTIFKT